MKKARPATILPLAALLLSLAMLIPFAGQLGASIHFAVSPMTTSQPTPPAPGSAEEKGYARVAALNLPALVLELPFGLFSADQTSWTPDGMDFRTWRALSYPIFGMFFWWLIGRGVEALRDASTRLQWVEIPIAALLFIAGLIFCIGLFTITTAEDRADANLHWIAIGVVLWLLLEAIPLTAGVKQIFRSRKKARR